MGGVGRPTSAQTHRMDLSGGAVAAAVVREPRGPDGQLLAKPASATSWRAWWAESRKAGKMPPSLVEPTAPGTPPQPEVWSAIRCREKSAIWRIWVVTGMLSKIQRNTAGSLLPSGLGRPFSIPPRYCVPNHRTASAEYVSQHSNRTFHLHPRATDRASSVRIDYIACCCGLAWNSSCESISMAAT